MGRSTNSILENGISADGYGRDVGIGIQRNDTMRLLVLRNRLLEPQWAGTCLATTAVARSVHEEVLAEGPDEFMQRPPDEGASLSVQSA